MDLKIWYVCLTPSIYLTIFDLLKIINILKINSELKAVVIYNFLIWHFLSLVTIVAHLLNVAIVILTDVSYTGGCDCKGRSYLDINIHLRNLLFLINLKYLDSWRFSLRDLASIHNTTSKANTQNLYILLTSNIIDKQSNESDYSCDATNCNNYISPNWHFLARKPNVNRYLEIEVCYLIKFFHLLYFQYFGLLFFLSYYLFLIFQ